MLYKILSCFLTIALHPDLVSAQVPGRQPSAQFPQVASLVGKQLPDINVVDAAGNQISTSDLRGKYTVLVFGCLT